MKQPLSELQASIDSGRQHGNLSSAVRLFVLQHYQQGRPDRHAEEQPAETVCLRSLFEGGQSLQPRSF